MFDSYGLDKPPFTDPTENVPDSCVITPGQIVDLSGQMDSDGKLRWDAPPGHWTVMRFGFTPTGSKVGPAVAGGEGLECDKLNSAALDVHFKNSLQPWFDDKALDPIVKNVHVDSYERGAQNWTSAMPHEFQLRRGYDLRRWLPVLTGRVVGGVRDSERFLWDFRNTVTSLMHENYFGRMRELCHQAGKQFSCEPYHQTQFDNVTAGGQVDIPMCEAWMGPSIPGPYWLKLGASPAHVYGKNLVGCEAFTAPQAQGGKWNTDFWDMKELGDAMFCGGVNRMTLHVYTHQPWLDLPPGQTLAVYGTHFERTNTWWDQMPAFTSYITRCQHLLRQGQFVADVLYSCGENSPNESLGPSGAMELPRGYDYDVCDPQVIFSRLQVVDGKLTLPEGGSYRVLVLPDDQSMTPAMVRRIGNLVEAGAIVVGPKPIFSPSLSGQPQADEDVRQLADAIWGGCDGKLVTQHAYGKGQIFWGKPMGQILSSCNILPDMATLVDKPLIRFIHRQLQDGNLYFLASSSSQSQSMDVAFRVNKGSPQLWDPISGEIRPLPSFREVGGQMVVPLRFEPRQSYFILIDSQSKLAANTDEKNPNFEDIRPVAELVGTWTVHFDPKRGGQESKHEDRAVVFEKLEDWTKRPEDEIKYFSGKATYRKVFDLSGPSKNQNLKSRIYLDLGSIKNVADVRLNKKNLGVVWCAPWRVEITGSVKLSDNLLEIDVVNLWPNRMIGDEMLPEDCKWTDGDWRLIKEWPRWLSGKSRTSKRKTFATIMQWQKDDQLLPSGLLGPVQIMVSCESDEQANNVKKTTAGNLINQLNNNL